jgi:hypothetical protein
VRTILRRLAWTLPFASAALVLAACGGGTSVPTAPADPVVSAKAAVTADAAAAVPVSMTVRGSVVDSSNRPLRGINIECLGDAHCEPPHYEPSADGHQHRVDKTDANGSYELVATSQSGGAAGAFSMNANGQGYQVEWRQVSWPEPACTADRCAATVNFRLTSVAD